MAVFELGDKQIIYQDDGTALIIQGRRQVRLHPRDLRKRLRANLSSSTFFPHFWADGITLSLEEIVRIIEWFEPTMRDRR